MAAQLLAREPRTCIVSAQFEDPFEERKTAQRGSEYSRKNIPYRATPRYQRGKFTPVLRSRYIIEFRLLYSLASRFTLLHRSQRVDSAVAE